MTLHGRKHPFTLVEILVVIGIIGILSGITVGTVRYVSRHNQEVYTQTLMKQIEIGLEAVHNRFGYYPPKATAGDFVLPAKAADTWAIASNLPVAYVKLFKRSVDMERLSKDGTTVKDAWGRPIRYQCPGTVNKSSFDLVSGGPDGDPDSPNQADNVANYELEN